jgi:hypothetical protein
MLDSGRSGGHGKAKVVPARRLPKSRDVTAEARLAGHRDGDAVVSAADEVSKA